MAGLRYRPNSNYFVEAPNFRIEEFVSKRVFDAFGREGSLWFIDEKVVKGVQLLRSIIGVPMAINNWHSGGRFQGRGYREPHQFQSGAAFGKNPLSQSQHRAGRASDSSSSLSSKKMFDAVMDNQLRFLEIGITCLEDVAHTPTWLHMDCRQHLRDDSQILIVKP